MTKKVFTSISNMNLRKTKIPCYNFQDDLMEFGRLF